MDTLEHTHPPSRLRTAAIVAGVALLVGLIVVTPRLVLDDSTRAAVPASSTARTQPDPAAMEAMLDQTAAGAGFGIKVSSRAQDTQNNVVTGSERSLAKRWVTSAAAPSGQELSVIVISEAFMTLEEAEKDCAARLTAGYAITCVASTRGDLVVQDIERGAERFPDGWPVVTADRWDSLGSDLWMLHQAIVRSPNGTTVYAHEAVRSRGIEGARRGWKLSQGSLRDAASSLTVPLANDT